MHRLNASCVQENRLVYFATMNFGHLDLDIIQHSDEDPLRDRGRLPAVAIRPLVVPSFGEPLELLVPVLLQLHPPLLLVTVDMRHTLRAR